MFVDCILTVCMIMYLLIVFWRYLYLLWFILYVSKYPVHETCKFALPG